MIQRIPYQTAPPRFDYQLTDSGRVLPVLDALLAWGLEHAVHPGGPVSRSLPVANMLAARAVRDARDA